MAEVSLFWNGTIVGDASLAPYDAPNEMNAVLMAVSGTFAMTNKGGVCSSQVGPADAYLKCTGASTPVTVADGLALVHGQYYFNGNGGSGKTVAIPTPVSATRIDRLVLRKDWTNQTVRITRLVGAEGGPEQSMTQNEGTLWDIPLAKVSITTGGVITLTDEREILNNALTSSTNASTISGVALAGLIQAGQANSISNAMLQLLSVHNGQINDVAYSKITGAPAIPHVEGGSHATSGGTFTQAFAVPFASNPSVVATPTSSQPAWWISAISPSSFTLSTAPGNGTFNWVAFGV